MSFRVAISQHDPPIEVEVGETVLEVALAQGVPVERGQSERHSDVHGEQVRQDPGGGDVHADVRPL